MIAKVLLVSDDLSFKESAANAIQNNKFNVQTASNFPEALEILKKTFVEIVLTEITLPNITGLELLHSVKQDFPDIRIIVINDTQTNTSDKILEKGAYAVIKKENFNNEVGELLNKIIKEIRGKILVVDDSKEIRDTLTDCLTPYGFEVDTADNGQSGLDNITKNDYDIVMMDISMPVLGGVDAVRKIKKIKPATFVVMMTGEAAEEEINKALEQNPGYYAVLRKPFQLNALLTMLRNLKKEGEKYKHLQTRSVMEKAEDFVFEEIQATAQQIQKTKKAFSFWALIVIFSLLCGLLAVWSTTKIPQMFNTLMGISNKIDKLEKKSREMEKKYNNDKDKLEQYNK